MSISTQDKPADLAHNFFGRETILFYYLSFSYDYVEIFLIFLFVDRHAAITGDFQTYSELCRPKKIRRLHQRFWARRIEKSGLETNAALFCLFIPSAFKCHETNHNLSSK